MKVYLAREGYCNFSNAIIPRDDARCFSSSTAAQRYIEKRAAHHQKVNGLPSDRQYRYETRPGWHELEEIRFGRVVYVYFLYVETTLDLDDEVQSAWKDVAKPRAFWFIDELEVHGSPLEALAEQAE